MPALHAPNYPAVKAITTATATLDKDDNGKIITNRGGGALTLTLPPIADVQTGWNVRVFLQAAGDHILTAPADKLAVYNDATATTLTISTDGEEIGNSYQIFFDGTVYLCFLFLGSETATASVA